MASQMNILQHAKIFTAVFFFSILTAHCFPADGQILGSTSLNVERRAHTATQLADGRILIVGGENASGPVSQAEIFDPNSQIFSPLANSAARTDHAATLLPDGRVLVTGGRDSHSLLDSTEIFNPTTESFSLGPPMRRARAGHTATVLSDGRILLAGGDADGSAEIYEPDTQSFSLLGARLEIPRTLHGAALLQDRRMLIAGGVDPSNSNTVLDSAEIFDPQSLSFSPTSTPMMIARGLPILRVLPDGKVQVIGGDAAWSMEMFNPETASFNALAHLPPTSDLLSATLSTQSRAALITTTIAQNPAVQGALTDQQLSELLDRADHSLTELAQSNQALVAGGINSSGEFLTSSVLVSSSSATVTTDRFDYAPGQTVTITGTGWLPDETILMVLHEEPETHADTTISSVADASGNFTNTDFAPAPSDAGRTFTLTAMGQSSGFTAQTAFTDVPSVSSATITAINGTAIPCSPCPTFSNPIHIEGTASVQNFQGQLSSYQVQIDWGDGTVVNASTVNFTGNTGTQCVPSTGSGCVNFSGTWSSNPDHSYATGGSRTITTKLYHTQPPGNDSPADANASATIIVTVTPTVTTAIHNGTDHTTDVTSVPAGSTVHDKATVTGNSATGTVTFSFWSNGTCSSSPTATSSHQSLSGGSVDATSFAQGPLTGGSYSFKAHYNGDSGNTEADSACEPLEVIKVDPTSVITTIHDSSHAVVSSVVAGTLVHDSATVSGSVGTPTGTVTFKWFTNGSCTGTPAATSSGSGFTLSGGTVDGTTFPQSPATSGSFAFTASYSGDGTYNPKDSSCEPLTVTKRHTTTTVILSPASVVVGQDSTATVTVTDDDANGTKSNPGVGTTVSVVSDSADTITGTCTLAVLNSDKSTCSVTVTPTSFGSGTHKITASFTQTSVHQSSDNSPGASLTVNERATTTSVSCTSPVTVGQGTTCTATVTDNNGAGASAPTGTVTLSTDGSGSFSSPGATCTLGSPSGNSNSCTATYTAPSASTHHIGAGYNEASSNVHSASTATAFNLTVNERATTTSVSCTSPVTVGQGTTCTATVTDNNGAGASAPTGTVTLTTDGSGSFSSPGATCTLGSPTANSSSCTATYTPTSASIHHIGAGYNEASSNVHATSTATAFNLTVNERATTTTVSCTSPVTVGQGTTCTATVTDNNGAGASAPTGTVTLSTDASGNFSSPGATCTLGYPVGNSSSCSATYAPISAAASTHHIGATYNEASSTVHSGSTATAFNLSVGQRATTTSVSCISPVTVSQGTTCTATVTDNAGAGASVPAGTVTFSTDGSGGFSSPDATCSLPEFPVGNSSSCSATYTPTSASIHHIGAAYNEASSTVHAASTVTAFNLTVNERATTTAVSCTSPVTVGQGTTCTATVTDNGGAGGSAPTGTVTLSTDASGNFSSPGATCTLGSPVGNSSSCSATYAPISAAASTHHIGATYNEASSNVHSGSVATVFNLKVNERATTTTVICTSPVTVGQGTTCTATVTDNDGAGASVPAGTVTFSTDGSGGFSSPDATCSLPEFPVGNSSSCSATYAPTSAAASTHHIGATYTEASSTVHSGSTATAFNLTANERATTTAVSCTSPVTVGQGTTCTATVTDNAGVGASAPTGPVTLSTDASGNFSSPGATCTLGYPVGNSSSCSATYAPISAAASTHHIGATYNEASSTVHSGSTATAFNLSVGQRATTTSVSCISPVTVSQGTTCTATVTDNAGAGASVPAGTVTFSTDGSGGFSSPDATCSLPEFPVGNSSSCSATYAPISAAASTHHIGATYNEASSTVHSGSTATAFNLSVGQRATSTAVTFSTNPVVVGRTTTATVTVTDTDSSGTKSNPGVGTIVALSSDSGDTITGTCTLAALSTDKSTCSVTVTPTHASVHTISATFAATSVHSGSGGNAGLTVNKRATTTTVAFSDNPIVETDGTTATMTVTDTDSNGTKSNPGVGTVVSVTSNSGDTIMGTCTLAALNSDQATCQVTVTPTHASIHTITATFSATTVHSGSAGNGQLEVTPHALVIQNLNFTPVGSTTSPRINVSHDILDSKRTDQTRDHVITSAQNIPRGCSLSASAPFSTQYDRSIVGSSNVSFKAWEVGKAAWSAAKRKRCTAVELKITSFSVQAFHMIGNVESPSNVLDLTQAPFTGTISVCFKVSDGTPLPSCPLSPTKKKNLASGPSVAARLSTPHRD